MRSNWLNLLNEDEDLIVKDNFLEKLGKVFWKHWTSTLRESIVFAVFYSFWKNFKVLIYICDWKINPFVTFILLSPVKTVFSAQRIWKFWNKVTQTFWQLGRSLDLNVSFHLASFSANTSKNLIKVLYRISLHQKLINLIRWDSTSFIYWKSDACFIVGNPTTRISNSSSSSSSSVLVRQENPDGDISAPSTVSIHMLVLPWLHLHQIIGGTILPKLCETFSLSQSGAL